MLEYAETKMVIWNEMGFLNFLFVLKIEAAIYRGLWFTQTFILEKLHHEN